MWSSCLTSSSSSWFFKTRIHTSSSSSAILFPLHPQFLVPSFSRCFRNNNQSPFLFHSQNTKTKTPTSRALAQYINGDVISDQDSPVMTSSSSSSSCRLYVCNLPRSFGISELHDVFEPYGTVQSVEVSRNSETGISRGCGHVTMSSVDEAKTAISALDASDVDGREMRVTFAAEMNKAFGSVPKKNLIFESPHKIYVGNLAHSVKPSDLRNLFSLFGTVVSSRVLHDSKSGKNRVYGFISFSSSVELENAISLDGTDFCGRKLLVREVLNNNKP
ncbi:RNA-binding (RRM/RBD/RNP motif) family protein [Abeliophyllum distichum]|uniref:RNA-binding (RRM/RBD/RNP motif) family protein n=1 Tax=Abeliophyllum distichum TaxID=126358 RepID=A0ABD1RP79_9LAMI